jgi:protein O-GlcNAc transferase
VQTDWLTADDGAPRYAASGMAHLAADRPAEALAALRSAIGLGDLSPVTLLNFALAEDLAGNTEQAYAVMRDLQARLPDWDEPPLRLAESLRRHGQARAAEAEYERALVCNPNRAEALISLAVLMLQRGASARAQLLLLRCCGMAPERGQAWDALGITLKLTGAAAAAEVAFTEAQRLEPDVVGIAMRRVDAAVAAGTGEAELIRLDAATQADPLNVILLTARGVLLEQLGRREEAADALEVAVALAPDMAAPANALAHVLVRTNRMSHAIAALEHAIALAPADDPLRGNLRNNRAAALVRLHRHREASAELEELIAEHGEDPSFLCNLTNALVSQGRQQDGLRVARRATALAPDKNLSWRTLCNALPYCDDVSGADLLDAYRHAGATLPRGTPAVFRNTPDPARRLRVGLLSTTLKTHPVGWLTLAGFEALDASQFDIVCLGQAESDDVLQRRFRAVASSWHVVDRGAGAATVEQIRALDIDVLIEMSGYGDQGLLSFCADRLAPVQIKWVGSQNHSTGLDEMDWFMSDRWETPPHLAHLYSENLLLLADGYVCYSPPVYAPDIRPLPMLARGHVTFGCFNNLAKITAGVIATWAAILHRLPTSRLVLKCHQLDDDPIRARLAEAFAAHAIAPDRIELRGSSPHRRLLDQYNDIDIVLDPFPYSGGLTTCEALWMGVPVITMLGESFASRHSTSHLSNAGLPDWIAADLPAYQALALHWANAPEALAALRTGMRARLMASPLCDAPRFGRSLATGLRYAWVDWCARQSRQPA